MEKGAIISDCGKYRYALHRIWDRKKGLVAFIGLNPSTADAELDDPTIRRCINFAKSWGYGGIYMLNLFAYRTTDPKVMKNANYPVGKENDEYIKNVSKVAKIVIAAWGNHGTYYKRDRTVKKLAGEKLYCLEKSKSGNPKHPLYLKSNLKPIPY